MTKDDGKPSGTTQDSDVELDESELEQVQGGANRDIGIKDSSTTSFKVEGHTDNKGNLVHKTDLDDKTTYQR